MGAVHRESGSSAGRPALHRSASSIGAIVVVLFACGGIDDNELHCEEAVSHLEDCCDGFEARRFSCIEEDSGCNQQSPDLYDRASECIRKLSCDELRSRGKCASLTALSKSDYPNRIRDEIATEACK